MSIQKKKSESWGIAKMTEKEGLSVPPSHRHTKITTIYRTTIYENQLMTTREDFPQLKIKTNHNQVGRRGRDMM